MEHNTAIFARQAAIDAMLRFTEGLDRPDAAQFESSLTEDAILDMTALSALGMNHEPIHGRNGIIAACMGRIGEGLETTHTLANILVKLNDQNDNATITCYSESQHIKKGQAFASESHDNYLMVKCRYTATVSKRGSEWRIERLDVVPLWSKGSMSVFGL